MKKFIKKEFILFLLIFLLGAFLRLYRLDYPLGLHGDEAWTGIEAQRILLEGAIGIWSPSSHGQPTLSFYWTAFIFKIFDSNILTLRLSYTLLNILVLPFFYLTGRLLFDKKIALISFFLFSTSRIFIHFSHMADLQALFLVSFLPSVFFFLLMLRKRKIIYAMVGGFFLGISQYSYFGLRILPILFITFLIYKSFDKKFLSSQWKKIVILFFISFVVLIPLGKYFIQHQDAIWTRSSISIFSEQGLQHARNSIYKDAFLLEIILKQIKTTLLMFNVKGDGDAQDNSHNLPLLDIMTGFLFIIGLFTQMKKIRSDSSFFLYIWLFIFLSGSILTVDPPNFRRVQPSIAAAYIFVGLGGVWILDILKKQYAKAQRFKTVLVTVILCYSAYTNIYTYFMQQAISEETKNAFAYPLVKVAHFLHTFQRPLYVYFYSSCCSYYHETLQFLLSDMHGEDRSKEFGMYSLNNNIINKNVIYIFFPEYRSSLSEVKKLYPNGKEINYKDITGSILFTSYYLPRRYIK